MEGNCSTVAQTPQHILFRMDLPEAIVDKLKCSQCGESLSIVPIYSYANGDFVCGRCPLIEDQKPSRDHTYEAVANYIRFPCINKPLGCNELLVPSAMKTHETDCYYRQWFCPAVSSSCNWQGTLESLAEHFASDHPELFKMGKFEVSDTVGNWDVNYLLDSEYLVQLKKIEPNGIYVRVSMIGFQYLNRKYNYKISWFLAGCLESEASIKGRVEKYKGNSRITINEGQLLKTACNLPNTFEMEFEITAANEEKREKLGYLELDILKKLECPVCFDYMSSPIYQCPNSHAICTDCKEQLNICGLCKETLGNLRNRQLEDLSEKIRYNCQFDGCTAIYNYSERTAHESKCEFSPYTCPFETCNYKATFKNINDHLLSVHSENICETNSINAYFDENYSSVKILKRAQCLFVVNSTIENNVLNVDVKFFGPKELDDDFYFIFELRNSKTQEMVYFRKRCDNGSDDNKLMVCVDLLQKFMVGICTTFYIFIEDTLPI